MSALQQRLVSPEQAAEMIKSGALLAIAADETVLATLLSGNWIRGTKDLNDIVRLMSTTVL
jgi:hypothetical protein